MCLYEIRGRKVKTLCYTWITITFIVLSFRRENFSDQLKTLPSYSVIMKVYYILLFTDWVFFLDFESDLRTVCVQIKESRSQENVRPKLNLFSKSLSDYWVARTKNKSVSEKPVLEMMVGIAYYKCGSR